MLKEDGGIVTPDSVPTVMSSTSTQVEAEVAPTPVPQTTSSVQAVAAAEVATSTLNKIEAEGAV